MNKLDQPITPGQGSLAALREGFEAMNKSDQPITLGQGSPAALREGFEAMNKLDQPITLGQGSLAALPPAQREGLPSRTSPRPFLAATPPPQAVISTGPSPYLRAQSQTTLLPSAPMIIQHPCWRKTPHST